MLMASDSELDLVIGFFDIFILHSRYQKINDVVPLKVYEFHIWLYLQLYVLQKPEATGVPFRLSVVAFPNTFLKVQDLLSPASYFSGSSKRDTPR